MKRLTRKQDTDGRRKQIWIPSKTHRILKDLANRDRRMLEAIVDEVLIAGLEAKNLMPKQTQAS